MAMGTCALQTQSWEPHHRTRHRGRLVPTRFPDAGAAAKPGGTRDQGVRFFVEVNGSNPEEVASEVDRCCSWPGQACGYKVGHTEINQGRDLARTSLGARFDLRHFNDAPLLGGNVPLDVLQRHIDAFVRSAR